NILLQLMSYISKGAAHVKVVTNDLYCGAYLLSKGGFFTEVKLNHNCGRQSCLFVFTGPSVLDLHQEFLSGNRRC
ncbi:MAG: hypothetical protein AB9903_32030, partial [Vulcanimicrobiota bacterium]